MKNKRIKKFLILLLILLATTGCTKTLTDSNHKAVRNEKTGQTLTKNIICRPTSKTTTELYEKKSSNKEYSGYGMEFTFRLKKGCYTDEETETKGICGVLQQLARVTFKNGELFMPYEYLYSGQTEGFDVRQTSKLTGFITIPDVKAKELNTPNGKVIFVEFIGVTDSELKAVLNKELTVKELYEKLGTDITDFNRDSII